MWDDHKFAIVPKAGKWVVHVLWNSSVVEIQERYHNLELQPLAGVSRHFFLCRFALAVFSNSPFLSQRVPRKLILVDYQGLAEVQVRDMTPDEYQRKFSTLATRANSRSQSPKERSRSAPRNEVDDGSVPEEPDSEDHDEEEEEDRGRSRKRKSLTQAGNEFLLFDDLTNATTGVTRESRSASQCRKRRRPSGGSRLLRTPPRSTSPAGL
jgi:hypothetical protein